MKNKRINPMPAILLFAVTLAIFLIVAPKKDPRTISASDMGEKYPYTVDNVKIKCATDYPDAIFIIDKNNNKYAVNGNADVYFTKIKADKNYKGYTTAILKDGMSDAEVLQIGLNNCRNKNDKSKR